MPNFPQGATDIGTPEAAEAAVRLLQDVRELAVDLEADAMHAFRARLCFVQVGTDHDVLLFDTLAPGVRVDALGELFANEARVKYFHAAGGDLQFLAEAGMRVKGLFDTHRAATLLSWPKVGLADLARELLGVELPKEFQQADFSRRPIPQGMRDYIADDVRYLTEIGRRVRAACEAADILEEVLLDCQRLSDEAAARPQVAQFRPKLPRGGTTPAQRALGRAIAAALHAKRLAWAEAANVPMGRMLSNAAITAVALKPPATLSELAKREGVRGAFVRARGEEVLALVKALSEQAARGELPEEDDGGKVDPLRRKREEALKTFRSAKAQERKVAPSVVLTNALTDALAADPPESLEALAQVPYLGEKRARLYGAELLGLLRALH